MPYEPRKRKSSTLNRILIVCLVVCTLGFFAFSFLNEGEEELYQIGSLSSTETKELLETKAQDSYVLSDYFFYGETLNLLKEDYNPEKNDEMFGKSVLLKDLCSDNEQAYVIGTSVDNAILCGDLKEGFYEIYVVENLIEKKAVMDEDVVTSIKTVIKEDTHYEVTLLASTAYFKEKKIHPKENYVYLQVEKTKLKEEEYDIAIDPSALDRDFNIWSTNYGSKGNDLVEYQESYKAATLLKKALEEKGYKVLIVREEEEERNSYGEEGRIKRAYDAKCKYYIRLCFSESEYGYRGFDIAYSAHSSNMFANQIIYHMSRNSDMTISSLYSSGKNKGVYPCILLEGMDGRKVYDSDLWIREAGGKATVAGLYSQNAKEGTGFFAQDNLFGMQALDIRLGYLSSKEDATYWKEHKEEYMQDLADAMDSYLNVSE